MTHISANDGLKHFILSFKTLTIANKNNYFNIYFCLNNVRYILGVSLIISEDGIDFVDISAGKSLGYFYKH